MVLVPGKSASAKVSRMVPMPSSSKVPGSFSAETSSNTVLRSCSLLSSQLSVELVVTFISHITRLHVVDMQSTTERGLCTMHVSPGYAVGLYEGLHVSAI